MADVKFSELSTMAASDLASADVIAIVDTSLSASKQLSIDNLFGAVPVNLAVTDLTQSTSSTTGSVTTLEVLVFQKMLFLPQIYILEIRDYLLAHPQMEHSI